MLKSFAAAGLLALAFVAPSKAQDWQKEWAEVQAKAKGQSFVISVHAIDGHAAIVREFGKKYPDIKLEITEQNPSQFAPRVMTEQKNGIYAWDLWWAATANMTNVVLPAGGFEKMTDYMILPEVKEASNWREPRYLYTSDKGPYILVHSYLQEATLYQNTAAVKNLKVESIDDLIDPKLKGKIALRDPSRGNNGTFVLASLMRIKGADFINKFFTTMEPIVIDNPRQITDTIMRADVAVAVGAAPDIISQCYISGGCKDVVRIPFGGYLFSRGIGVLKNAPHKEATKVFINWFLSKEGQETYVREWAKSNDNGAMSFRKDVATDPKQKTGEPDYTKMDQYFIAGAESGEAMLSGVMKMYTDIKNRSK